MKWHYLTNKTTLTIAFLLLASAALFTPIHLAHAGEGDAGEPTSIINEFPNLETQILVPDGEYYVGDVIPITLQVTHPAGYRLLPLELEDAWGDLEIRDINPPVVVVNPDGSETTSQVIEVFLWAPGEYSTPELSISVADTNGEVGVVTADQILLNIGSVLIEGDTNLRDIKPQAQLPLPPVWPWVIAGLLGLVLLTSGSLWLLRRRRLNQLAARINPPDLRKPHEVALDELERIEGLNLPELGRFKEHYTLASDVMRQYMETAFHIPTLDRTTGEIRRSLKYSPLSQVVKSEMITILSDADLVKFAKVRPEVSMANSFVPRIRNTVAETIPPEPISENGNGHKPKEIDFSGERTPVMEADA